MWWCIGKCDTYLPTSIHCMYLLIYVRCGEAYGCDELFWRIFFLFYVVQINYVKCCLLYKKCTCIFSYINKIIVLMTETVMNGDAKSIPSHTDKLSWRVSFVTLGRITVSLPLGALFVCFVSAIIFQFDEVNQTVCQVCSPVKWNTLLSEIHSVRWDIERIWQIAHLTKCAFNQLA